MAPDAAYKPLVFGGTYPIEVPTSPEGVAKPLEGTAESSLGVKEAQAVLNKEPKEVRTILDAEEHKRELRRTIERSLDKFEAILSRRGALPAPPAAALHTFDIDAPLDFAPAPDPLPRTDAAYYVSGPKTFNIDEPY